VSASDFSYAGATSSPFFILGARNEEQLRQNLGAVGWSLTTEQIERLCDRGVALFHVQFLSSTQRVTITANNLARRCGYAKAGQDRLVEVQVAFVMLEQAENVSIPGF
jgi:hypothetical protein